MIASPGFDKSDKQCFTLAQPLNQFELATHRLTEALTQTIFYFSSKSDTLQSLLKQFQNHRDLTSTTKLRLTVHDNHIQFITHLRMSFPSLRLQQNQRFQHLNSNHQTLKYTCNQWRLQIDAAEGLKGPSLSLGGMNSNNRVIRLFVPVRFSELLWHEIKTCLQY